MNKWIKEPALFSNIQWDKVTQLLGLRTLSFNVWIIRTGEERKGNWHLMRHCISYFTYPVSFDLHHNRIKISYFLLSHLFYRWDNWSLKIGIARTAQHPKWGTTASTQICLLPKLSVVGVCSGKSIGTSVGKTKPVPALDLLWKYTTLSSLTYRVKELVETESFQT